MKSYKTVWEKISSETDGDNYKSLSEENDINESNDLYNLIGELDDIIDLADSIASRLESEVENYAADDIDVDFWVKSKIIIVKEYLDQIDDYLSYVDDSEEDEEDEESMGDD